MPIDTRTFRVFVSSTFDDLVEERNALQRVVFPALAKLCESRGARFQAIDLRWGIRDEAALDQQTMDICLAEIDRCQRTGIKPNFIVLLGHRYGWRPLPARIDAREFETLRERIADRLDRDLVDRWYRRDDNAVPPEYLLQPRTEEYVAGPHWRVVEDGIRHALDSAAQTAELSAEARVKYVSSATHQEILKGLGTTADDRRHVFAYLRSGGRAVDDFALGRLKAFLRVQLGENVFDYREGDLGTLAASVTNTLTSVIAEELSRLRSRSALELETDVHNAFATARSQHLVGRDALLQRIASHIASSEHSLMVVHGPAGSGKSAVVAQASILAARARREAVVVRRFIGVSPQSSDGVALLRGVCLELGQRYGIPGDTPDDFSELATIFTHRLGLATAERPLVLFVDALDQLDTQDPAASLSWLPHTTPAHCHVVVSTVDVPEDMADCRLLKVEPLPVNDAATALSLWLDEAGRTLTSEQRRKVLASFGFSGLPLYLRLAFEEARRWRSFDTLEHCVLGPGLDGMIDQMRDRLSTEANHGPTLIRRAMGYLAAARYGLTDGEMLDVLSRDEPVWTDFLRRARHEPPERRLPVIVWSRLSLDLEPYLSERTVPGGTTFTFYHRRLAERFAGTLLSGDEGRRVRTLLADYFADRAIDERQVDELPWQLCRAEDWPRLRAVLEDPHFIASLCESREIEAATYWAQVETHTGSGLSTAYEGLLHGRMEYRDPASGTQRPFPGDRLLLPVDLPARLQTAAREYARTHSSKYASAGIESFRIYPVGQRARYALVSAVLGLFNNGGYPERALTLLEHHLHTFENDPEVSTEYSTLLQSRALALLHLGRIDEVLETLSQRQTAHSNDAGSDDDVWAIEIRNSVAAALCLRGELDRPMELFVRNEPAIRRLGEHHQLAENLINQSHVYLHRNRLDDAMVRLKEAEAICARHGYLDLLQACLGNLGVCHRLQKRYPEAMNLHERQERICVELGNLLGRAQALGQQGLVFRARGERAEAMGRFQAQASLCRSIHNSYWLGFALGMLAELFTADGRYAEAAAALEEQEAIHRQMGASAELAICLAKRAKLLINHLGRSEDGRLVADQAQAVAQTSGDATVIERTTRLLQLGDAE